VTLTRRDLCHTNKLQRVSVTVQTHGKSIFVKLGVHDRTEALAVALRLGIIHIE
jgi:DNA-binding NarL/FixJ family response regulator